MMNNNFPAFPTVLSVLVGRFGVAVRTPTTGGRSGWYIFRHDCPHVCGPFGTRGKARNLLEEPNFEGEPEWGSMAAWDWDLERSRLEKQT